LKKLKLTDTPAKKLDQPTINIQIRKTEYTNNKRYIVIIFPKPAQEYSKQSIALDFPGFS